MSKMTFKTSIRDNVKCGNTTLEELLNHFLEHTIWDPKDLKDFLKDIAPWIPKDWFVEGKLMISDDETDVLVEEVEDPTNVIKRVKKNA